MDPAVNFVDLDKNLQFKSILYLGGLFYEFAAFCRIYLLLYSSHWLLRQMIQHISFIPNQSMHVEGVNQGQNSHSIPLCFAHFMLTPSF